MVTKDFHPLVNINNFWEFLGTSPLLFNGIYLSCQQEEERVCDDFWSYYSYNNRPSIEKLAQCLCKAETQVESVLGTSLFQKNYCDKIEVSSNFYTGFKPGINIESMTFKTTARHVISYGQEEEFLHSEDVVVTYYDDDGDGFKERGVIEFIYAENTELCNYLFMFPNTHYEIRDDKIKVINSTTRQAEITFDAWNLVKPSLYLPRTWKQEKAIDGCDINNFTTTVDIYYTTISTCKPHGFLYYHNHKCNGACEVEQVPFCVLPVDDCMGTFRIRLGKLDDDGCFVAGGCPPLCACPVSLVVYYRAGLCKRCDDNCGDGICYCAQYEHTIFKLASACLPDGATCCACFIGELAKWQTNTSLIVKQEGVTYTYSQKMRENPFGSTIGQIEAAVDINRLLFDSSLCLSNLL